MPAPLATLTRRIEPLSAAGIAAPRSRRMNGSSAENAHATAIQNGMAAGQRDGSGYNRYSSSGSATATAPLREGGPFRTGAGLCANGSSVPPPGPKRPTSHRSNRLRTRMTKRMIARYANSKTHPFDHRSDRRGIGLAVGAGKENVDRRRPVPPQHRHARGSGHAVHAAQDHRQPLLRRHAQPRVVSHHDAAGPHPY